MNVGLIRRLCEANAELGVMVVELLVLVDETIPLYEALLCSPSPPTGEQKRHIEKLRKYAGIGE